jgi:predicted methyltransferase
LTGYGISASIIDGARRVLLVDVDEQTVKVGERVYSFEQYITYEDVNWDQFYG